MNFFKGFYKKSNGLKYTSSCSINVNEMYYNGHQNDSVNGHLQNKIISCTIS